MTGWRSGPPIGLTHVLGAITCALIGHHEPYRGHEAWDSTRRVWFTIDPSISAIVCHRCKRTLNGWTLWFR